MAYYKCGRVYTTQNSNVVVDTSDGAIANFNTPLSLPLIETKFGVKATQDLNGQSAPYPAGGSAQIWDEELESGYIDNDTGGNTSSYPNRARSKNYIPTTPQTAYYFVSKNNVSVQVLGYDENKNYIGIVKSVATSQSFTTLENCYFIRFKTTVDYALPYKNDFSINYPSSDTAYHPYSNICPITGVSTVSVTKCGKNLFDPNYLSASGITIQNGEASGTASAFSEAFGRNRNAIPNLKFKANTRYALSFKAYTEGNSSTTGTGIYFIFSYTDGTIETRAVLNNQSTYANYNIVSNSSKSVKSVHVDYSSANNNIWHLKDIQLEEGASVSEFEAYNGSTTLINLGGTYYGGYVTQDKNGKRQFKVTHKKYVFDGTEQWSRFSDTSKWFTLVLEDALYSDNITIMSDKFVGKTSGGGSVYNEDFDVWLQNISAYPRLYICDSSATQKSNIQALTNGASVVYPLAEPFTVALPDGEPIKSFPGINNIFCDTGDISLQFRKIG